MTDDRLEIMIMRVPLTTPCPVKVNWLGESTDTKGVLLPDEQRTEYCAVDAQWMIGLQRVCDIHLRLVVDEFHAVNGTFADILQETFSPFGEHECATATERALRPWSARKRYSQEEAKQWAEK